MIGKGKSFFFIDIKQFFLEKLQDWLKDEEIYEPKLDSKLKTEISSLISLDIVKKGRQFSGGVFIKHLLKKIWQRLNYNTKFIESRQLSDKIVARRTLELGTSTESQIKEK